MAVNLTSSIFVSFSVLLFRINILFLMRDYSIRLIGGVAMGSPLGPSMSHLFMCVLETRFLDDCPSLIKPMIYHVC